MLKCPSEGRKNLRFCLIGGVDADADAAGAEAGAAGAGAANAMGTNRVIAAAANERMLNERICVMKGKKIKRVIVSE